MDPADHTSAPPESRSLGGVSYALAGAGLCIVCLSIAWLRARRRLLALDRLDQRLRNAELGRKESEIRYRLLTDNSNDIIATINLEGCLLSHSPSLERILGYSRQDVLKASVFDFIHPSDLEAAQTALREHQKTVTVRCRCGSGGYLWLETSGSRFDLPTGEVQVMLIARDVTFRMQAAELVTSQKRILEMVATEIPLSQVLGCLVDHTQQQLPGIRAFVFLMDANHRRLNLVAGASLPEPLQTAWQTVPLSSPDSPFARAAGKRELTAILREDNSQLWNAPDILAACQDMEAIWAQPILSRNGEVLGALGCLVSKPAEPNSAELEILNGASYLAGVAVDRAWMYETLKNSTDRLRRNNATLVQLAQSHAIREGNLEAALKEIAQTAASGCSTNLATIWMFEQAYATMRCIQCCENHDGSTPLNLSLLAADHPSFVFSLASERVIAAHDAQNDPRTAEFLESYLRRFGIHSMLCAAIRVRGEVIGFLSLERTDSQTRWTQEDELFVGSVADIVSLAFQADEQRRAEEALRVSEERYRSVVDSLAEGVMLTEPDGRIATFNASATRILGLKPEELKNRQMGDPAFTAIREDGSPFPVHQFPSVHSLRTGEPTNDVIMGVLRPDGSLVWISTSTRPLSLDPDGKLRRVVISFIDITEKRRSAEELRRAHDELEHRVEVRTAELRNAIRELSDFAYIITHDLKAPLRAVGNLSDWLAKDYLDRLGTEGAALFQMLRDRVTHMHNLIDGILAYTRIGRTREADNEVDLQALLPAIVQMISPPEGFTVQVEPNLPTVRGIRPQLHQIFQNLLDNAVKHHNRPDGKVEVSAERQEGAWLFRVADDGPGIDPKYHEKIFKIFQRLGTEDLSQSAGIGLALVKRTVEARGGRVWIESSPGEGSRFFVLWPDRPIANNPAISHLA